MDSCLLQITTNANLLHGVRNPEVVHQIRVGLRRLRAAFATFKPILPPDGLDRLERETEWLSAELEPARDLDVFIRNEFASAQGRVPSLDTLDRVGRHEVRIKAKKLRYAGEFFSKSFGKGARNQRLKFIASLAALQDALGDLNDMATARRSALAVAGRSPELCFRAGLVIGGRDRDEPRLLAKAVQAYRRWTEAKPFWN